MLKKSPGEILFCSLSSWQKSVPTLLDAAGLGRVAATHGQVLIKPNLVGALAPPITTPVALVEAIIHYLSDFLPFKKIIIGEGCGSIADDTHTVFQQMGYSNMAQKYDIRLLDLNNENCIRKEDARCQRWPEMYLPEILDEVFLLSVPQLKAHSFSKVTLSMKNMIGCAPPRHYKGSGAWNKSAFHRQIHEAIFDLNCYRTPDFTLLDATVGMARAHLWGPKCKPPVGKLAASYDPVAIDSFGTSLLGMKWQQIPHIAMAHEVLGLAEPLLTRISHQ